MAEPTRDKFRAAKSNDVIAGGTVGSILVALCDLIPDPYQKTALYFVPLVAVIVGKFAIGLTVFGGRELQIMLAGRDLKRGEKRLAQLMASPSTSEETKRDAMARLETLKLKILDLELGLVEEKAPVKKKGT